MKIAITDRESDLTALATGLARNARASGTTLERIVALNPHLAAAARIPAGSVLRLPEDDLRVGAGTVPGGSTLTDLSDIVGAGIKAAATRAKQRFATVEADYAAVKDALKTARAKKLLEADPLFAKRVAAAEAQFKVERKQATENKARFAQLEKSAQAEFARLEELLERRES
jgi:hypothetical protein